MSPFLSVYSGQAQAVAVLAVSVGNERRGAKSMRELGLGPRTYVSWIVETSGAATLAQATCVQ